MNEVFMLCCSTGTLASMAAMATCHPLDRNQSFRIVGTWLKDKGPGTLYSEVSPGIKLKLASRICTYKICTIPLGRAKIKSFANKWIKPVTSCHLSLKFQTQH